VEQQGVGVAQSLLFLTADWIIRVRSPAEVKNFFLASVSRPAVMPTQPPTQGVPGILSPGVKHGRGVGHSSPSSAEVKKCVGSIIPLSLCACMVVVGQLYFTVDQQTMSCVQHSSFRFGASS
jgi:hypothetical protein